MNSYLHVLNTYVWRWRFWIFGGLYVWLAWGITRSIRNSTRPLPALDRVGILIPPSLIFVAIIMAFFALHVRRQFGTPQAHLVPGFFVPHYTVFVVLTSLFWVGIPWCMAARIAEPALPLVAAHASAAIFLGLVVLWPQALSLLVGFFLVPALLF